MVFGYFVGYRLEFRFRLISINTFYKGRVGLIVPWEGSVDRSVVLAYSAKRLKLVDLLKSIFVMAVKSVLSLMEFSLFLEFWDFKVSESCYRQMFFLLISMKLFSICCNFFFMLVKF